MISGVSAKDITIGPKTPGGLKKAIDKAEKGDTIYLKNGVYKGANNRGLEISKSINIVGKGNNVVIDAQRKNRTFLCLNKETFNKVTFNKEVTFNKVTFKNLKIKNGYDKYVNGAAIASFADLTVSKCTFTNNQAEGYGGAIWAANVTVSNCTFKNNEARMAGGGAISCSIISRDGKITVSKSTFTNNKAKFGGGAIHVSCYSKTIKISDSKFTKNIADKVYNAFYINLSEGGKPSLKNVKITPKDGTKVKK